MKRLICTMIMALAVAAAVFAGNLITYDSKGNEIKEDIVLTNCQNMDFNIMNPKIWNFDGMTYGLVGSGFSEFLSLKDFDPRVAAVYKKGVSLTADWFKKNANKKYTGPAAGYLNVWEPECRHILSNLGPKWFKHTRVIVVFAMKDGNVQWDTVKALPVYDCDDILTDGPRNIVSIAEKALSRANWYLERDPNDVLGQEMKVYAESYIKLGQTIEDAYVVTRVVYREMYENIQAINNNN